MIACTLFRSASQKNEAAQVLYGLVVSQARHPVFYTRFGIADTVDGRFDMIVLHVFFLLRRLSLEQETRGLAQALFDVMFHDMDHNLRAMGVSDLQVGGKVRDMLRAFYGRVNAYDTALAAQDDRLLAEVLQRNVYRNIDQSRSENIKLLIDYIRKLVKTSAAWSAADLRVGRISFVAPL